MKNAHHVILIPLLLALNTSEASGQDRSMLPGKLLEAKDRVTQQPSILEQYPLETPLDPASYRVGGGDRLSVQIETVPPLVFTLTIGADGDLLIPTVGKVSTSGRNLVDAKKEIQRRVQQVHRETPVSVSLAAARRVFVRVRGSALVPQSAEATASDRVSTLMGDKSVVRSLVPYVPDKEGQIYDPVPVAQRSILLRSADGAERRVDLDRFYATGEQRWNPHLAEGDEVIANVFDESIPSTAIGGAVWLPGKYEYVTGDRVGDVVLFARGIEPRGRRDSVILARVGERPRALDLGTRDSLIDLQPGDRLWVPYVRLESVAEMVSISGEVMLPGVYPLIKGVTRLSELISMAGGPTGRAMIHGATLHRTKIPPMKYSENRLLAFRGNMAIDDTVYLRQENDLRLMGERVNVDFRRALERPGSEDDPLVEPGDRIEVPRRTGTVYVFGQVVSPGHVPYRDGASFSSYVAASGGMTDRAKSGDAVVIKYASRQWLDPSETTVEEGDAIWVPKEIEQTYALEIMTYGQVASILSSLATLVLVITQISK